MEQLWEMLYGVSNGHVRQASRHVTPKGQGRDLDIFEAKYLENAWR